MVLRVCLTIVREIYLKKYNNKTVFEWTVEDLQKYLHHLPVKAAGFAYEWTEIAATRDWLHFILGGRL